MKVSTKGRYGLRVMTALASRFGQGPVLVDTIARDQKISAKYIHVIITGLKSAGLIRSVRGPNGGYELTRDPATISALDIIRLMEGSCAPVDCVDNAAACGRSSHCAARELWTGLEQAMAEYLSRVSLADLARRQHDLDEKASPVSFSI